MVPKKRKSSTKGKIRRTGNYYASFSFPNICKIKNKYFSSFVSTKVRKEDKE